MYNNNIHSGEHHQSNSSDMQNNLKYGEDLAESPSTSKEAWPAEYVKSEFLLIKLRINLTLI